MLRGCNRPEPTYAYRNAGEYGLNGSGASARRACGRSRSSARGKLTAPDDLPDHIEAAGFAWLPISAEHAWRVRELPPHHRDPFDRLLIAQSLTEGMPIVSGDAHLRAYGVETRW
jgi:PIN domain